MIGNTIEYIMSDIRTITENVIIKYTNEAEKYENINKNYNLYIEQYIVI